MNKPLLSVALAVLCLFKSGCNSTVEKPISETTTQGFKLSAGVDAKLTVPQGFKLAFEHFGFVQPETFSRITLSEIEIPYTTYITQLNKENLQQNKLLLTNKETVNVSDASCTLLTMKTLVTGNYFEKLWLICGDKLSSVQVEASYPEGSPTAHKLKIKDSLFSLGVATDNTARLYTGLPFIFENTPNFKAIQRNGNSIVFQSLTLPNAKVVVGHGSLQGELDSLKQLSDQLLYERKSLVDIEITKTQALNINNVPALATQAYAIKQNKPSWVYQLTSAQGTKFLLIQAISPKEDKAAFTKQLEALITEFKFR